MICPHCKNSFNLKDDNKYCPFCGRNVYERSNFVGNNTRQRKKGSVAMIGAAVLCGIVLIGTTLTATYMVAKHKISPTEVTVNEAGSENNNSGKITVKVDGATTQKAEGITRNTSSGNTNAQQPDTNTVPPAVEQTTESEPETGTTSMATTQTDKTTTASKEDSSQAKSEATTKKNENTNKVNNADVAEATNTPATLAIPQGSEENGEENVEEKKIVCVFVKTLMDENEVENEILTGEFKKILEEELLNAGYDSVFLDQAEVDEANVDAYTENTVENEVLPVPDNADFVMVFTLHQYGDSLEECSYEIDCYPDSDKELMTASEQLAEFINTVLMQNYGIEMVNVEETEPTEESESVEEFEPVEEMMEE